MNRVILAGLAIVLLRDCDVAGPRPSPGKVSGTWGGDNAGLIVDDTSAHVHIACTFGNVAQGIEPGTDGRFDVPGEYVLRAYPVYVGPSLPARFQGSVAGRSLTLTVIGQDTTADTTATLGLVKLYLGREPQMQMCPICRKPGAGMPR